MDEKLDFLLTNAEPLEVTKAPEGTELMPEEEEPLEGEERLQYEEEYWFEEHSPGYAQKRELFFNHRRLPAERVIFDMESDDLVGFSIEEHFHECPLYPFLKSVPQIADLFDACMENVSVELAADEGRTEAADTETVYANNNNFELTLKGVRQSERIFSIQYILDINPE